MGIKDQLKKAAATVGTEASRAGRMTQAQAKLTSLKKDLSSAEKDLGEATFELFEQGQLPAPALEPQLTKVCEARAAVAAKEADIAAIKAQGANEAGTEADQDDAALTR